MVLHGGERVRTRGRTSEEGIKLFLESRTPKEHIVGVGGPMEVVELVTECEQLPISEREVVDYLAVGSRVGSRGKRRRIDRVFLFICQRLRKSGPENIIVA